MVTKRDLDVSISELKETFKSMLESSIDEIKNSIIENLKISNENLQLKVKDLEGEIKTLKNANIELEKRTEAALQHGRLEQIIVSGIPDTVKHDALEDFSIRVLNSIKTHEIIPRDIAACHRLGKNNDTILRFVNRKDADDCLENCGKLRDIDRGAFGLKEGGNIYIRGNLSPYMSKLAYFCRVLKRKGVIDKTTSFKGIIKIFRTVGNRSLTNVIAHKSDLEKIFPNLDELLE